MVVEKKHLPEFYVGVLEQHNRGLRDAVDDCDIWKVYNETLVLDHAINTIKPDIDRFTEQQKARINDIEKDMGDYFSDLENCECKRSNNKEK